MAAIGCSLVVLVSLVGSTPACAGGNNKQSGSNEQNVGVTVFTPDSVVTGQSTSAVAGVDWADGSGATAADRAAAAEASASVDWQSDSGSSAYTFPRDRRPSKFRKLIFAAAIVPVATILAVVAWHKKSSLHGNVQQAADGNEARPKSFAGIVVGSMANRPPDSYSIPANHPWYNA